MSYINNIKTLVCAGLLAASIVLPANATRVLTWTDGSPNRGTRAEAAQWFADELEKRTNGELKIEFHWGGALLKPKAAVKGIGAGAADMGLVLGVYNPKLHQAYILGDLPTPYSDPWVSTRAIYDLVHQNKDLQAEFADLNLQYITNVTSTEIQLICKDKPVKTLDDVKGLKIRGIGVYGKIFSDFGAANVAMPVYESYQAIDTGLVNCTQIYGYAIPAFKLQEIAKEITKLDWGALLGLAYVMNKDTYDSLTPEQQKIINDLGVESIDYYVKKMLLDNDILINNPTSEIDGTKVNIYELSDADKARLLEATSKYLEDWRKGANESGVDAAALQTQFLDLLKKYDDERKAKDYPWNR
ncbi:C4-dicarboxylate TRAP transporter substrate-binding protein [Sneathiella sp.]|uniref:C4-dicarboxylate TRAP transporter substrate-binding protein n=1 Tax=Sneathiella sp. TaxID=1964365 RepID=UPI0026392FCE|nr:C4-dicarboxylate TRAP transporter substrate-binding protein [Sneathiella sp.]MDF2368476.1 C4-dicarboxylate TRAP transporter substrate-binding protein [Sneathiella sp.]